MLNLVEFEKRCKISIWSWKSELTQHLKRALDLAAENGPPRNAPVATRCACAAWARAGSPLRVLILAEEHYWDSTSDSPFSAVSTPILTTKYSFCSVFRDLQDLNILAPLESRNFSKIPSKICWNFREICKILMKFTIILQNFDEIWRNFEENLNFERCKSAKIL